MNAFFNDVTTFTPPWNADNGTPSVASGLMSGLPRTEIVVLRPKLEFVRLRAQQILHEAGDVIKHAYFVERGLLSIVNVQTDGKNMEVGLVGSGGFIGLPIVDGFVTGPHRIISQADGTAHRIDATALRELLPRCPQLSLELHRYAQCLMVQAMQMAACNGLHEVEQRLARWLLMSHEFLGSKELPLTQDILGQMLGTRRSSVTVAVGALQRAGTISCGRGRITILDDAKLQNAACECYPLMKQRLLTWSGEPQAAA